MTARACIIAAILFFFAVNDFAHSNERTISCNEPFHSLNHSHFICDNITQNNPIEIKSTGFQEVKQCEAKETW